MAAPTVTDLFCGAGGSSTGAAAAGLTIAVAANHWQTAIDVHQVHHPDARHDVADISAADPRRYPITNILLASPECTNHSQARGVSRKQQDATLFDQDFDPAAEKSRATMWCVVRFAEQIRYDAIVVENVVEATKWVFFRRWLACMTEDLGYEHRILSHNSMHHGVPQSRDRIYIVFWRKGLRPNLEMELPAWCHRCEAGRMARQAWKNERTVGRYRSQYVWACTTCGQPVEPATNPAASIIDWSLACPRIGDRTRPLAVKTRARILAGLQRHGWAPITTAGAGNTHERTPGNRARPVTAPLDTQQTTTTTAVATPPGFLVQTAYGTGSRSVERRVHEVGEPLRAVTTAVTEALVITNDHANRARGVDEPLPTATSGNRHGVLVPPGYLLNTAHGGRLHDLDDPHPTVCASDDRLSLVVPMRNHGNPYDPSTDPLGAVAANGNHHALIVRSTGFTGSGDDGRFTTSSDDPLPTQVTTQRPALLMRNNGSTGDGGEMVTPATEPARAMTTKGHQTLLMPYYGRSVPHPVDQPIGTQTSRDTHALVDVEALVDDCGFRMLEPYEVARAMAFPDGYIPRDLTKKDQVKLAGNAVTPPVMTWITGRLLQALETAA